jgi:hypothetical protein
MEAKYINMINGVLNYLYDNRTSLQNNQNTFGIVDIQKALAENKIELNISDVHTVLKKLYKENYVYFSVEMDKKELYCITFEGKILKEQGGYIVKINEEEKKQYNEKFYQRLTLVFLGFAGLGALIASAYYVYEILQKISPHHCHH